MIISREVWLCVDCTIVAVNGDTSGIDSESRIAEVYSGLDELGPSLSPNWRDEEDEEPGIREFSSCGCDCCGSRLAGTMHRFALMGEERGE